MILIKLFSLAEKEYSPKHPWGSSFVSDRKMKEKARKDIRMDKNTDIP